MAPKNKTRKKTTRKTTRKTVRRTRNVGSNRISGLLDLGPISVTGRFEPETPETVLEQALRRTLPAITHAVSEGLKKDFQAPVSEVWKMGNGEMIRMSHMDEGHLRNAIALCCRRILAKLGTAVWVEDVATYLTGLNGLLHEAKRRNIRV